MHELVSSSGFRGLAMKDLSPELCVKIGLALSLRGRGKYLVGHDVRLSSHLLAQSIINGLNAGGSDVVFIGLAPTPALAFYSKGAHGGAMITASHNPPEYNGIKLFDSRGASVTQEFYMSLLSSVGRAISSTSWDLVGSWKPGQGLHAYIESVVCQSTIRRKWKVGLDLGNGATTVSAPISIRMAGCEVSTLNLVPEGRFTGRGAEPEGKALEGLCGLVKSNDLDLGFAYDGDGDRVAIIDDEGVAIPQDLALGFVASRMVRQGYGRSIVVNVDTSAIVDIMVESAGGRVYRSKVGDVFILEELLKKEGAFGGESCGAWIFPKLSLCPDGVLSSIMFLNLLDEEGIKPSQLRKEQQLMHLVRKKVQCANDMKAILMDRIKGKSAELFKTAQISDIDGVRLEFPDKSWVLARTSGTEPLLRVTAEAADQASSERLAASFVKLADEIMGDLKRKQ